MSADRRMQKLEEYKYSLCAGMGMECSRCICEDCPRDCEDCPRDCEECEERGVEVKSAVCLYEGDGKYRKEEKA